MSRYKNTKSKYNIDMRKVFEPNPNTIKNRKNVRAKKFENGEDMSKVKGRKSYSEKIRESGQLKQLCAMITSYRESNPDCSPMDVYRDIMFKYFPYIYTISPDKMYVGNVKKMIDSDQELREAYYTLRGLDLRALADYQMKRVLSKDNLDDNTIISAYDKVNKYDIIRQKMLLDNTVDDNTSTDIKFILEDEDE
jgi:hypothetical protein